jgi:hypothetical protein
MPAWLRVVAHVNPLTYEVHGMRQLLLGISAGGTLWLDFVVGVGSLRDRGDRREDLPARDPLAVAAFRG